MYNYTNPYTDNYVTQCYLNKYQRENMVYILDIQTGDVNGDRIPDTVYLTGEKGEGPFYENIKVIVQDGRTMQRYIVPLHSQYSSGTDPWLFIGSFSDSGINDIMVNLPTPGSGALTYYYLISFRGNNAEYILGPQQLAAISEPLQYEVIYQDYYKVLVRSGKLNQSYVLDVSNRKESYEGKVYDEKGMLIKPLKGFVIYLAHLYPVKFGGSMPYKLMSLQDIAGTARVDGLGSIVTYWRYTGDRKWVLDPEMFFVMLN